MHKNQSNIIILNGTSSAGKSTLAKELQKLLPTPYLHIGIDSFIDLMPAEINKFNSPNEPSIGFWCKTTEAPCGTKVDQIMLGEYAKKISSSYKTTVAHLLNEGHNLILDEVFLGGIENYRQWQNVLIPYNVLLVGVIPPLKTIEEREVARGDRRVGTARSQYHIIHDNIPYDLIIDNAKYNNNECAKQIIALLKNKFIDTS